MRGVSDQKGRPEQTVGNVVCHTKENEFPFICGSNPADIAVA